MATETVCHCRINVMGGMTVEITVIKWDLDVLVWLTLFMTSDTPT